MRWMRCFDFLTVKQSLFFFSGDTQSVQFLVIGWVRAVLMAKKKITELFAFEETPGLCFRPAHQVVMAWVASVTDGRFNDAFRWAGSVVNRQMNRWRTAQMRVIATDVQANGKTLKLSAWLLENRYARLGVGIVSVMQRFESQAFELPLNWVVMDGINNSDELSHRLKHKEGWQDGALLMLQAVLLLLTNLGMQRKNFRLDSVPAKA